MQGHCTTTIDAARPSARLSLAGCSETSPSMLRETNHEAGELVPASTHLRITPQLDRTCRCKHGSCAVCRTTPGRLATAPPGRVCKGATHRDRIRPTLTGAVQLRAALTDSVGWCAANESNEVGLVDILTGGPCSVVTGKRVERVAVHLNMDMRAVPTASRVK